MSAQSRTDIFRAPAGERVAMVVRCTVKMLKLLGVRPSALAELEPDDDDWYVNLLDVDVITLNRRLQRTLHSRGRDCATPLQLVAERGLGQRE